jgi:hypothetical protein
MWTHRESMGVVGAVVLVAAAACSSSALEDRPSGVIDTQEEKWMESAPGEYVIRVCTQGFAQYECVQESVVAGRVVASKRWQRTDVDAGWTPLDPADRSEPVARLFDAARERPDAADCRPNDVAFDEEYGYVSSYVYLCFESWGETVECFVAGTTDVEACGEPDRAPPAL